MVMFISFRRLSRLLTVVLMFMAKQPVQLGSSWKSDLTSFTEEEASAPVRFCFWFWFW